MRVKQTIVMRRDLNMSPGKMTAQGAHASTAFLCDIIVNRLQPTVPEIAWIASNFTKICLFVDSEQELADIARHADELGVRCHLIVDEGLTEFDGVYTLTCLGLGPDYADNIDPITRHLPLI